MALSPVSYSAIDEVNCAREMRANLYDQPELKVRIGIHLGDVVFSNNTVIRGDVTKWRHSLMSVISPWSQSAVNPPAFPQGGISARSVDGKWNRPQFAPPIT
jgi:hypothetical protein